MIITRTPFRISFFGGGSDFPEYFNSKKSIIISSSIDKFCYTSLKEKLITSPSKYKFSYSIIDEVNDIKDIEHPVIKACLSYFKMNRPLEIHYDADLPGKSGIGSSSSFTISLLHALHCLKKNKIKEIELAKEAIHIERNILKEYVGFQDQYACSIGGFNNFTFHKKNVRIKQLNDKMRDKINEYLVMFYYPNERLSSNIQQGHVNQIKNNSTLLDFMNDLSIEALKVIEKSNIVDFSKLLHESWLYKKSFTKNVSNGEIDNIYDTAINNGALAGKVSGAGGGGFIYFLCNPRKKKKLIERLSKLIYVDAKLHYKGSEVVYERKD